MQPLKRNDRRYSAEPRSCIGQEQENEVVHRIRIVTKSLRYVRFITETQVLRTIGSQKARADSIGFEGKDKTGVCNELEFCSQPRLRNSTSAKRAQNCL